MIFASKFPVGLTNLFLAGLAANAQQFVIILFGCGRHNSDSLAESEAAMRLKLHPTGVQFRQFGLLARQLLAAPAPLFIKAAAHGHLLLISALDPTINPSHLLLYRGGIRTKANQMAADF